MYTLYSTKRNIPKKFNSWLWQWFCTSYIDVLSKHYNFLNPSWMEKKNYVIKSRNKISCSMFKFFLLLFRTIPQCYNVFQKPHGRRVIWIFCPKNKFKIPLLFALICPSNQPLNLNWCKWTFLNMFNYY
jgi:hypothetical protein